MGASLTLRAGLRQQGMGILIDLFPPVNWRATISRPGEAGTGVMWLIHFVLPADCISSEVAIGFVCLRFRELWLALKAQLNETKS